MSLRFLVKDKDQRRRRETLQLLLVNLGFQPVLQLVDCDLLVVHHNTDALKITPREQFLAHDRIYVAYTGGPAEWQTHASNWFDGNYNDLIRRLNSLTTPITRDGLLRVLRFRVEPRGPLPALALLCQGYLAVHAIREPSGTPAEVEALRLMGWPLPQDHPGRSLIRPDLAAQWPLVVSTAWWNEAIPAEDSLDQFKKEWDQTGRAPFPDDLKELLQLIESKQEIQSPDLVARVYLSVAERLRAKT